MGDPLMASMAGSPTAGTYLLIYTCSYGLSLTFNRHVITLGMTFELTVVNKGYKFYSSNLWQLLLIFTLNSII